MVNLFNHSSNNSVFIIKKMKQFLTFTLAMLMFITTSAQVKNTLIVDGGLSHSNSAELNTLVNNVYTMLGWTGTIDVTTNLVEFNSLPILQTYDIIFLGNEVNFTAIQQGIFETAITNGIKVINLHSAMESYPHSSIGGTSGWDYYSETITGYSTRIAAPRTTVTLTAGLTINGTAPAILSSGLPAAWIWTDEFPYEGYVYTSPAWQILYTVGSTGGDPEDMSRPMVLYTETGTSRRATCLIGNDPTTYSNVDFTKLICNLFKWVCDNGPFYIEFPEEEVLAEVKPAIQNPVLNNTIDITGDYQRGMTMNVTIYDLMGRVVHSQNVYNPLNNGIKIPLANVNKGLYILHLIDANRGHTYINRKIQWD